MSAEGGDIRVDVAWSPGSREVRSFALTLRPGATLGQALLATGCEELVAIGQGGEASDEARWSTAVWGRARPATHVLRDGDRVEVLRALLVAPMDARRVRFEAAGGIQALRHRGQAAQKR